MSSKVLSEFHAMHKIWTLFFRIIQIKSASVAKVFHLQQPLQQISAGLIWADLKSFELIWADRS